MTVEENLEMGAYTRPNSTIAPGIADVYKRFPRLTISFHMSNHSGLFEKWRHAQRAAPGHISIFQTAPEVRT